MLKITVDVTPIDARPSGVGLYVFNLIEALSKLESSECFELGLSYQPRLRNWLKGDFDVPNNLRNYRNLYQIPVAAQISKFILDYLPSVLPSHTKYIESNLGRSDVFHGTDYVIYPMKNSQKIVTIYDLSFIKYPEYSTVKHYTQRLSKCLQWTDAVITISESSKQDIVNYLNIPEKKVFVTPLASRYNNQSLLDLDFGKEVNNVDFDFSKPYLLFVSTIEPRKNINSIIQAFNFLKQKHKIEHQLVLIGKLGWKYESIFTAIKNSPWKDEIKHLNYLSDELVALFYAKADVFVYPSHYEGFGLPVLEAMTLGAPVVTSNTSSIPEVAGDAAMLIDPNDFMQIAEAILKLISDHQLRQDLISKGKVRANLFSWENTAKETLKAYKSVV